MRLFAAVHGPGWPEADIRRDLRNVCCWGDSVAKLFGPPLQGLVLSSGGSSVTAPVVASIDAINT